jgi:UDP-N-acetylglucosamine transferase subunit ALG13
LRLGHSFIPNPAKFDENHAKKQLSRIIQSQIMINTVISDINSIAASRILNVEEKKALKELKDNQDIVITTADKGQTWVIMKKEDYIYECERQLQDDKVYRPLEQSQKQLHSKLLRNALFQMLKEKCLTKRQFEKLAPKENMIKDRVFYCLPKIHKDISSWSRNGQIPPGRPIISNTHSADTEVSSYIDRHLQPIVNKQPYILKNSEELLAALKNVKISEKTILFSLDVRSLYTNIPLAKGMEIIKRFFEKHPEPRRPDKHLLKLLQLTLFKNEFAFNGKYYTQRLGVAMGKQFSPSFANLYMSDWEQKILSESQDPKPSSYFRYIDDIFGTWDHSLESLIEYVEKINSIDKNIQVTLCTSFSDIQFLDLVIFKDSNFSLSTFVHLKPTSTLELIHPRSLHPKHTKSGVILSQIVRFIKNTTYDTDFRVQLRSLLNSLSEQGYSRSILRTMKEKAFKLTNFKVSEDGKIIKGFNPCKSKCKLCVSHGLEKASIKFSNGSKVISQNLTCTTRNAVYCIVCNVCNKVYVGETKNSVKQRLQQHLSTIRLKYDTPVSQHFNSENHSINDVKFFAICHNPNWSVNKRRSVENQWISKLNSLTPNGINIDRNIINNKFVTFPFKGRSLPPSISPYMSESIKPCFTSGTPLRVIFNHTHRIALSHSQNQRN